MCNINSSLLPLHKLNIEVSKKIQENSVDRYGIKV